MSKASESTSTTLLDQVKAGDSDAWRRLVQLYCPLVYKWCRQCDMQAEDAADVAQEVFSAVARHVSDYRRARGKGSFRAWLVTITRNKIRDHYRRRQGRPQARGGTEMQRQLAAIPDLSSTLLAKSAHTGEKNALLHRVLELVRTQVEVRTWEAFWRLTVEEHQAADIAADLDMHVRAVYEAKYRVLRRIRREMHQLGE